MSRNGGISVSIDVTNSGKIAGEEVIQLYIQDVAASTIRPVQELKGFQKLMFEAGETKSVTFEITEETLAFYGADQEWKAEPGDFVVMIGGNSIDLLKANFSLSE